MSGHYRQTAATRQEDQSTAESDIVSAKEPQCGRWGGRESLWMKARHPGRGTGDSPHMQAAASGLNAEGLKFRVLHVIIAPEGKDNPWWSHLPIFST